jgi:hypothetical protein
VREHNAALRDDPANLTKSGRLKRGLRVNDSMDIKKPEGYVGGRFKNNWYVGSIASQQRRTILLMLPGRVQTPAGWRCLRCSGWAGEHDLLHQQPAICPGAGERTFKPGARRDGRVDSIDAAQYFREAMSEVRNGR